MQLPQYFLQRTHRSHMDSTLAITKCRPSQPSQRLHSTRACHVFILGIQRAAGELDPPNTYLSSAMHLYFRSAGSGWSRLALAPRTGYKKTKWTWWILSCSWPSGLSLVSAHLVSGVLWAKEDSESLQEQKSRKEEDDALSVCPTWPMVPRCGWQHSGSAEDGHSSNSAQTEGVGI